jgi:hypothetical protein
VGPTAGQGVLDKRTISYPWHPARSAVNAPPYRIRYSGIPAVVISTAEHFILMNSEKLWTSFSSKIHSKHKVSDFLGDTEMDGGKDIKIGLG